MNGRYNNPYRNLNRRQHTLRRRKRRRLAVVLTLVIVLCLIWAVAIFWLSSLWRDGNMKVPGDTTGNPSVTDPAGTDPSGTTEPGDPSSTTEPQVSYRYEKLDQAALHKGDLILVNSDFPYVFPANHEATLKTLYGNKSPNYKIAGVDLKLRADLVEKLNTMFNEFAELTGLKDTHISSAYRTMEYQQYLYEREVARVGEAEAALYVALPGNSEHHIGTAIDVNIYKDEKIYQLPDIEGYNWVTENFHRYGFILRYPADKIGTTGIGYEPWHFRYVGVPHAAIIKEKNYCLEEYIHFLRKYTFTSEHLQYEVDGTKYEIYYIPMAEGENAVTDVPVPTDLPYSISGNNVDGFIVTVTLD